MTSLDTLAERLMDSLDRLHGESVRKAEYCIAEVLNDARRGRDRNGEYNADYGAIHLTMERLLEQSA